MQPQPIRPRSRCEKGSNMSANVRHSSESNEHYTPSYIVDPCRIALGGDIDLDPASCAAANRVVDARRYYTKKENGFLETWHGRVFLNPPGGRCDRQGRLVISKTKLRGPCTETGDCGLPPGHKHEGVESSQKAWWTKLAREYASGRVTHAVFLSFSIELLQTSQVNPEQGTPHDHTICLPDRRIPYVKADGTVGGSPPHASMLIYLGPHFPSFVQAVRHLGRCMGPRS
jgi:hypothetical protein